MTIRDEIIARLATGEQIVLKLEDASDPRGGVLATLQKNDTGRRTRIVSHATLTKESSLEPGDDLCDVCGASGATLQGEQGKRCEEHKATLDLGGDKAGSGDGPTYETEKAVGIRKEDPAGSSVEPGDDLCEVCGASGATLQGLKGKRCAEHAASLDLGEDKAASGDEPFYIAESDEGVKDVDKMLKTLSHPPLDFSGRPDCAFCLIKLRRPAVKGMVGVCRQCGNDLIKLDRFDKGPFEVAPGDEPGALRKDERTCDYYDRVTSGEQCGREANATCEKCGRHFCSEHSPSQTRHLCSGGLHKGLPTGVCKCGHHFNDHYDSGSHASCRDCDCLDYSEQRTGYDHRMASQLDAS